MGREVLAHNEFNYGAPYNMADFSEPLHYGQGVTMRPPASVYPDDTIFRNGGDYLHLPSPLSRSSDTVVSPFGFPAELQQTVPNVPAASSTTNNII